MENCIMHHRVQRSLGRGAVNGLDMDCCTAAVSLTQKYQ